MKDEQGEREICWALPKPHTSVVAARQEVDMKFHLVMPLKLINDTIFYSCIKGSYGKKYKVCK